MICRAILGSAPYCGIVTTEAPVPVVLLCSAVRKTSGIMCMLGVGQARGADIYAEFLGGSFTCDAYHMTEPHPEGRMHGEVEL